MTPRERTLILRLAAAEVAHEARSALVLRRILRDLGWDDASLDDAVARLVEACGAFGQVGMWERAA